MLRTVIGFILVLLSYNTTASANTAKSDPGWRYSALSMAGNGSFGGDFRNRSKRTAERLAEERCQMGNRALRCYTVSVRYKEGSQAISWLAGMRCHDVAIIVTGTSYEDAQKVLWNEAYHSGFDPNVDCDLKEENLLFFPADSIFD